MGKEDFREVQGGGEDKLEPIGMERGWKLLRFLISSKGV